MNKETYYALRVKGTTVLFVSSIEYNKGGVDTKRDLIQYAMLFDYVDEMDGVLKFDKNNYEVVKVEMVVSELKVKEEQTHTINGEPIPF